MLKIAPINWKTLENSKLWKNKNFQKKKIISRPYDTQDSRVVPHRSTDWAQQCLTSQFGWDAV